MKRVTLFLATNLAILVVLSITLRLLGVERILDARGVDRVNMPSSTSECRCASKFKAEPRR